MRALNLVPNAVGQSRPQLVSGQVSGAQPAPALFSDPLYVVIPQWRPDYYWKITAWTAASLPTGGEACTIIYDDQRTMRVVVWNGAGTGVAPSGPAGGALSGDYPNPTVTNLPKFLTYGSVTVTYPGGQGYTPVANITPSGGPTGMCYAVASCQTDSSGEGRNVATISADVAAAFVNANTIDGSSPSGGTTVLIAYTSWALS